MLDKIFKFIEKFTPLKWRWILNHEGFKRYFANTGWLFGGQAFNLLISFFIGIWMARYLGPENYGVLSYTIAFVGLFAFIADLGISNIVNRELVKFPERRDEILGTALRLKIGGGIIALIIATGAIFLLNTSPLIRILVFLYSLTLIAQAINIISIFFQAQVEAKRNVRSQIISALISSLLKVIMIFSGLGVVYLIIIYVLDPIWLGLALVRAYRKFGLKIKNWSFNSLLAKEILLNSWPLMLASAISFIYLRIDQVMIGSFLGNREVGIYAVAVKLVELWFFVPVLICSSFLPALINSRKTDFLAYKKRLRNLFKLLSIIALIILLPIFIFAGKIILILFGSEYISGTLVLRITILTLLPVFVNHVIYNYLVVENFVKFNIYTTAMGAVLNVGLNLWLIKKIGISGAAVATLISYSFLIIAALFFAKIRNGLLTIFRSSEI